MIKSNVHLRPLTSHCAIRCFMHSYSIPRSSTEVKQHAMYCLTWASNLPVNPIVFREHKDEELLMIIHKCWNCCSETNTHTYIHTPMLQFPLT